MLRDFQARYTGLPHRLDNLLQRVLAPRANGVLYGKGARNEDLG